MSVQVSIQPNQSEFANLIRTMKVEFPAETQRALALANVSIKNETVTLAKLLTPISPTKAQYIASLKGRVVVTSKMQSVKVRNPSKNSYPYRQQLVKTRQRVKKTNRTDFHPGQLTSSITGESSTHFARIFVPANSRAGKYAGFIHFGTYNRGPGTIAKGPQADRLYIQRAIQILQASGRYLQLYRQQIELVLFVKKGFSV